VLVGGGSSTPSSGHFTRGKETRCPLYRRLCGPEGLSGRVRKNSPLTGTQSSDRPACSESLYFNMDDYFVCHVSSAFLVSCTAYNRRDSKRHPRRSRARQEDSEVSHRASRPCFVPAGCALSMPASSGVRRDLVGEEGTRRGLTSYRGQ